MLDLLQVLNRFHKMLCVNFERIHLPFLTKKNRFVFFCSESTLDFRNESFFQMKGVGFFKRLFVRLFVCFVSSRHGDKSSASLHGL